MKATQLYRAQLGLSQEAIAQYLGIARSQLAMYEAGKRYLTTAALVKLAEISVFFDQNDTSLDDSELLKEQEQELELLLAHQVKELEYKQMKEQRRLDAIRKKYNQNVQLYVFAQYLQKSKSPLAASLLQQATSGIQANGLAKQVQQQLKIESVQGQLAYIERYKPKIGNSI